MHLMYTPQTQLSLSCLIVCTLSTPIYLSNSPGVFGHRAILIWGGIETCNADAQPHRFGIEGSKPETHQVNKAADKALQAVSLEVESS